MHPQEMITRLLDEAPATPARSPWVGALLGDLRTISGQAGGISGQLAGSPISLSGRRCMTCAFAEVTRADVEAFIAARVIRACLPGVLAEDRGEAFLDQVLMGNLPDSESERDIVAEALSRRDITVESRGQPMQVCPVCDSDAIKAYRWTLDENGQFQAAPIGTEAQRLAG